MSKTWRDRRNYRRKAHERGDKEALAKHFKRRPSRRFHQKSQYAGEGENTGVRVPISEAKRIAKQYGWDQIIIIGRIPTEEGKISATSWGKDPGQDNEAGQISEWILDRDQEGYLL